MADRVVVLSIPQLRGRDITPGGLGALEGVASKGQMSALLPPFPGLGAPAFATLMTGLEPHKHGLIGNTFYDRVAEQMVQVPLADSAIHAKKLWQIAREVRPDARVMLWFAPNSRGADVDMMAWVDKPRRLRTRPEEVAGELESRFGTLPDDAASATSELPFAPVTSWMIRSAGAQIANARPDLAIVRLPYLGQVARRYGPDGREAGRAVASLNAMLGPFLNDLPEGTAVLAVTESIVTPVTEAIYPNRILRDMGLLRLEALPSGGLGPDLAGSSAFAVADHQLCHIYLNDPGVIGTVASIFSGDRSEGVGTVVASAEQRAMLGLDHERAGEVVLVACPEAWFAPDWWHADEEIPAEPSESELPMATGAGARLDPQNVSGSLGAPPPNEFYHGVLICSEPGHLHGSLETPASSTEVIRIVGELLRR